MSWTESPQTLRFDAPVRDRSRSGVHLTRRGRTVVLLVLVSLLLAAFSLGRSATEAATATSSRTALPSTTVASGETLWAVAQRIAPGHDPRPVIEQIQRLNDLDGATLQVGQQLLLPKTA